MNVNLNLSFGAIKQKLFAFLHRSHVLIFSFVVLGGLVVAILMLNGVVVQSGDAGGYSSATTNAAFDQDTIKRIEELKTSDEKDNDLNLSNGQRINPFVE